MIKTRNASENELSSTVIVSCVFGLQILFFFYSGQKFSSSGGSGDWSESNSRNIQDGEWW